MMACSVQGQHQRVIVETTGATRELLKLDSATQMFSLITGWTNTNAPQYILAGSGVICITNGQYVTVISTGGGGGTNYLPLTNFWTGPNTYSNAVSIATTNGSTQTPFQIITGYPDYAQSWLQNTNASPLASAVLSVGNDLSSPTSSSNYVEFGINSSAFTNVANGGLQGDGFVGLAPGVGTNFIVISQPTNGHVQIMVGGNNINSNKVADFSPTNATFLTGLSTLSNITFNQGTNSFTLLTVSNNNNPALSDYDLFWGPASNNIKIMWWRSDLATWAFNDTNAFNILTLAKGNIGIGNGLGGGLLDISTNGTIYVHSNTVGSVDFINRNLIGTNGQPILIWGSNLITSVNGGMSVSNALASQSLTVTNNSTLKGAVAFQYPAASGYGINASGKISLDGNDITTDGNGNMNFNAGGNITTVGDVLSSLAGSLSNVNYGSITNNGVWFPSLDNWVFAFNNTNAGAYTNKAWSFTNLVAQNVTVNGVVTGTGSISNNLVTNALIYDGVLAPNATVPTISATNAAQFTALPTITGNDRRMSISFTMQGSPVATTNLMTVSYATARPQADFLGMIVPLNNTAAALAPVSRLYVTNLTTANFQIWCGSAIAGNGVYQIGVVMVQ